MIFGGDMVGIRLAVGEEITCDIPIIHELDQVIESKDSELFALRLSDCPTVCFKYWI
jgi:hypothetical protein